MDTFLKIALDGLEAHVAVLDSSGTIIYVNRAWRDFGTANGLLGEANGIGSNYFDHCSGEPELCEALREVFAGARRTFVHDYPCHSPEELRWFQLRARRVETPEGVFLVLSHENVSEVFAAMERRLAEAAVKQQGGVASA